MSRVTGALSGILVLVGLGINIASAFGWRIPAESIFQIATWALAAVCGAQTGFSVWHREHLMKEKLEARLARENGE